MEVDTFILQLTDDSELRINFSNHKTFQGNSWDNINPSLVVKVVNNRSTTPNDYQYFSHFIRSLGNKVSALALAKEPKDVCFTRGLQDTSYLGLQKHFLGLLSDRDGWKYTPYKLPYGTDAENTDCYLLYGPKSNRKVSSGELLAVLENY